MAATSASLVLAPPCERIRAERQKNWFRPSFRLISATRGPDCGVAELLITTAFESVLGLQLVNFPHVLCVVFVRRNHLGWHSATSSFCQCFIVSQKAREANCCRSCGLYRTFQAGVPRLRSDFLCTLGGVAELRKTAQLVDSFFRPRNSVCSVN